MWHLRPREVLFEFVRRSDRTLFRCELRYHNDSSVEVQFYEDSELHVGRRFDTKALAVQWARVERRASKKGRDA